MSNVNSEIANTSSINLRPEDIDLPSDSIQESKTHFIKNRMPISDFIVKENHTVEFIENPKKPGSMFFACGAKLGGISKAIKAKFEAGTLALEDMEIALLKSKEPTTENPNPTYGYCIMSKNTANVKQAFGANLLRG